MDEEVVAQGAGSVGEDAMPGRVDVGPITRKPPTSTVISGADSVSSCTSVCSCEASMRPRVKGTLRGMVSLPGALLDGGSATQHWRR